MEESAPVVSAEPRARLLQISDARLDVAAHLAAVQSAQFGAVAVFVGQVRDHDPDVDRAVVTLEYSAHPDAERILETLSDLYAAEADGRGTPVAIAASHRIGELAVGDIALVACVASAHRQEAFRVCRELVEAIKTELPIWKRQTTADGAHTWVGL